MTHDPSQSPWYKQIWAWFIIAILAFAVFIGIGVVHRAVASTLVELAIAVVVCAIAGLVRTRPGGPVIVIAVRGIRDVAGRLSAGGHRAVHVAVAIAIGIVPLTRLVGEGVSKSLGVSDPIAGRVGISIFIAIIASEAVVT